MKKVIALILAIVLAIVCCACNSNGKTNDNTSSIPAVLIKDASSSELPEDTSSDIVVEEVCEHVFADATCTAAKTCTKCQKTEGKALGHKFTAATCTSPKICTVCQSTGGSALGHSFTAANCRQPQICTKCSLTLSELGNHNYVMGECTICGEYNQAYCPKIYFSGNMDDMNNKKDVRGITFEYRSKDQIIKGAAKIKVQGTSSLSYLKKNYTINFYADSQYKEKMGVNVGWGKQSEYCLKANWIDKTHSRNVVTAKLVGEIQKKYGLLTTAPNNGAIDGFPVEIYINGEFHGLYTMNIPKAEWMFNMDKNNPNHIVLCGENWTDPVLFRDDPNFKAWSVEVGPENEETLEKFKRVTDFVRKSTDEEFKTNFNEYLNLDATLNYYVMMHYGWMPDNVGKNMLMATYDGKVWYPVLYDLDTTWGTDWVGQSIYDYKNTKMETESSLLWERLEALYSKEIAERYFELRASVLDTNHVMNTFENFYGSIPKEVLEREIAKWGPNIPGYGLSQIQEYLNSFIPMLDNRYANWMQ